jgi:DNA-binding CsgD family transcriptional regulator
MGQAIGISGRISANSVPVGSTWLAAPPAAPAPELIGRRAELRALDAALDRVEAGGTCCVTVVGEPGSGKTALLNELRVRAHARGFGVGSGNGTEFERRVPLWLTMTALDELLEAGPSDRMRRRADRLVGEQAAVVRALAARDDGQRGGPPELRYAAHGPVRRLLELLSRSQPLALALDDLHWADAPSIELLAQLLRRPPRGPLLLAFAYRRAQLPRVLAEAIAAAGRVGARTELELGPLSELDASRLVRARVRADRFRWVYGESGGNPLYLLELARGGRDDAVPSGVHASVAAEVQALPPTAGAVMRAAALLGEPFEVDLVAAAVGVDEPTALAALDELADRELLRHDDVARRFRFRHPIVARATAASVSSSFAIQVHARAAAALADADAPIAARAHHVERCASPGDEAAIELLARAGHESADRSPEQAARWLGAALRLTPARDGRRRLDLMVARARALIAMGRFADSRKLLTDALALAPPEAAVVRARILSRLAAADRFEGDPEAARARLAGATGAVARGGAVAECALQLEAALDWWLAGDWERMAALSAGVLERARTLEAGSLELRARAGTALGEASVAHAPQAAAALDAVTTLLSARCDGELRGHVLTLLLAANASLRLERYDRAAALLRRALAIAQASGQLIWAVPLTTTLALVELWRGRVVSASAHADAATQAATALANDELVGWSESTRCLVRTLAGDPQAAEASAERARRALRGAPDSTVVWLSQCWLGAALIEQGEAGRGVAAIMGHCGGEELARIEPCFRGRWCEILMRGELAEGRVDRARAWLQRLEEAAATFPAHGRVEAARAELELAGGDPARAAALAEAAAQTFDAANLPLDRGRALTVAGAAHARAGACDDARRRLLEAGELLRGCGARLLGEAAEQRLATLTEERADGPLAELTVRQREVSELVARGMTNRKIAAELVISDKTVERHLARIFEKLEIGSRAALAATVERARTERERPAGWPPSAGGTKTLQARHVWSGSVSSWIGGHATGGDRPPAPSGPAR